METLLAKALESKLKYYLRSYSRDQFKLQGRTVQLSNLGGRKWAALSFDDSLGLFAETVPWKRSTLRMHCSSTALLYLSQQLILSFTEERVNRT